MSDEEGESERRYVVVNGKLVENEGAVKNFALDFDEGEA